MCYQEKCQSTFFTHTLWDLNVLWIFLELAVPYTNIVLSFFPYFEKLVSGGEITKMLNDILHSSQKDHIPAVGRCVEKL